MLSIPANITRDYSTNRSFLRKLVELKSAHSSGLCYYGFVITSISRNKMDDGKLSPLIDPLCDTNQFLVETEPPIKESTGHTVDHRIIHPMSIKYPLTYIF